MFYLGDTVGSGERCPVTGIWRSEDGTAEATVMQGGRMPYHDGDPMKWTLVLYT